jgi:hypothetical protein
MVCRGVQLDHDEGGSKEGRLGQVAGRNAYDGDIICIRSYSSGTSAAIGLSNMATTGAKVPVQK